MSESQAGPLLDECRQIEEDSRYTAEVHYLIGAKLKWWAVRLKFVPPVATAITALILALAPELPSAVAWLTALGALVTITAMILEPERVAREHIAAAKEFTVMKHEARLSAIM